MSRLLPESEWLSGGGGEEKTRVGWRLLEEVQRQGESSVAARDSAPC